MGNRLGNAANLDVNERNLGNEGRNVRKLGGNVENRIEIEKAKRKNVKSNFLFLLNIKQKKEIKIFIKS